MTSGTGWPVALRVEDGLEPQIVLRPLTRRDRRAWVELRSQNAFWLRPWDATRPDGSAPRVRFQEFVRTLNADARAGRSRPFAIEVDGRLVGSLTLSSIIYGALRSASVGYWLAHAATGRGTMTRSIARLLDYAFEDLGLHRVEICVRPENTASLAVVARLGLRAEGRRERFLHIDGQWRDHLAFAVTAEERGSTRMADRVLRAPRDHGEQTSTSAEV